MSDLQTLEDAANEIMQIYEIEIPPVPIEMILQKPRNNMWREMDVTQLSGSFLSLRHPYSPRMSLTRMLARHVAYSDWGEERGLAEIVSVDLAEEGALRAFARMLVMPGDLMAQLTPSERTPDAISEKFEVPPDDAERRLEELAAL